MGSRSRDDRSSPSEPGPAVPGATDLETLLGRRVPLRTRVMQGTGLVLVVAAVMAVLARQVTSQAGGGNAQLTTGPGPVVVASNVSTGRVTLNGRLLPGSTPLILPVRQGTNTITLSAVPFRSRSCRLLWGSDGWQGGDCAAEGRDTTVRVAGRVIHPDVVLYFALSDSDLPADQAAQAQAVVARALSQQGGVVASVMPGEYIATGGTYPNGLTSEQITQPTMAAISYGLAASAEAYTHSFSCFSLLCAGPLFLETTAGGAAPIWQATLAAYYRWSFVSAGQVSGAYPLQPAPTVALTYHAALGWQLAPPSSIASPASGLPTQLQAGLCGAAALALMTTVSLSGNQVLSYVLRDRQLAGCEMELTWLHANEGRFLWRFGVLLAADAAARATGPTLPVAPPSEVAAVEG